MFAQPPITAFRRPINLKDQLVRATTIDGRLILNCDDDCKREFYFICQRIPRKDHFLSFFTWHRYERPKISYESCEMNASSPGQCTMHNLWVKLNAPPELVFGKHLADIPHDRGTPVARHVNTDTPTHYPWWNSSRGWCLTLTKTGVYRPDERERCTGYISWENNAMHGLVYSTY